jgi:hypothetical protein
MAELMAAFVRYVDAVLAPLGVGGPIAGTVLLIMFCVWILPPLLGVLGDVLVAAGQFEVRTFELLTGYNLRRLDPSERHDEFLAWQLRAGWCRPHRAFGDECAHLPHPPAEPEPAADPEE